MAALENNELLSKPEVKPRGGYGWSYAMIKVAEEGEDEIGQIVEIVWGKDGTPDGFAKANLITVQEVEMAAKDIASQGGKLNTYFWDNGTFGHKTIWTGEYYVHDYYWTPNESAEDADDLESWKQEQATQAGMMGGTQAFLESNSNFVVNSYDREDIWDSDEDDY